MIDVFRIVCGGKVICFVEHILFWCCCLAGFIVVAGDFINWLWSFRDFGVKTLSAYAESSKPSEKLLSRKVENRILWGFSNEKDYTELSKWVSNYGVLNVALVANSVYKKGNKLSKRGIIGFGKIVEDMLIGKYSWNYWPILPKPSRKWDWKFYIEVEYAIPKLLHNIEYLRSLEKEEFSGEKLGPGLADFIRKCSTDILTLIPSNVTQGSKFAIEEHEYRTLRKLALKLWKIAEIKQLELSNLKLDNVLEVVRKYGLYYSKDVLVAAIAALRSGKHLLLMGAPATGKSMLAKVLADALGFELYTCTASSAWSRYDFIGGLVLGEGGRLEWRSGHLLKALSRHLELKGKSGVIFLIEELNRAEADKVLAEFFTMFPSSNTEEWRFPEGLIKEIKSFREKGTVDEDTEKLLKYIEENNYKIPSNFRVIATVNTFDRAFLFTLGYALQRRFAVLEILPPENREKELEAVIAQLKRKGINVEGKARRIAEESVDLIRALREATKRPLGLGITVDTAVLAYEMIASNGVKNVIEAVQKAAIHTVLPQLELLGEEVEEIVNKLKEKYGKIAEEIRRIGLLRGV